MTQKLLITFFLMSIHVLVLAQKESLPSSVFEYKMIPSQTVSSGAKKEYVDWNTVYSPGLIGAKNVINQLKHN